MKAIQYISILRPLKTAAPVLDPIFKQITKYVSPCFLLFNPGIILDVQTELISMAQGLNLKHRKDLPHNFDIVKICKHSIRLCSSLHNYSFILDHNWYFDFNSAGEIEESFPCEVYIPLWQLDLDCITQNDERLDFFTYHSFRIPNKS